MSYVIVPDFVADAINKALDEKLKDAPGEATKCRGHLFNQLLEYYNEHGEIPDFDVVKKDQTINQPTATTGEGEGR